jgi:hypothetical protein
LTLNSSITPIPDHQPAIYIIAWNDSLIAATYSESKTW